MLRFKNKVNTLWLLCLIAITLQGQSPLAEIEGRLSIYNTGADSSSISIGRNAGLYPSFQTTSVGVDAGTNNTTSSNSFFGYRAGHHNSEIPLTQLPDGSSNSFFGAFAGEMNQLGAANSFYGAFAGRNSRSYSNSFIGAYAGEHNYKTSGNSFVGSFAGRLHTGIAVNPENGDTLIVGNNNSFFGDRAGYNNKTGEKNTFLGALSGYNNSGGDYSFIEGGIGFTSRAIDNVFLGYKSGHSNTTGSRNIFIGSESGANNIEESNSIYIGHQSNNLIGSENIVLGPGPYVPPTGPLIEEDFRLYIGAYEFITPLIYGEFDNQLLRVNGALETEDGNVFMRNLGNTDTNQGIKWGESNDDEAMGIVYDGAGSTTNNRLHIREYVSGGPGTLMTIKASGEVGIGTESPNAPLHINQHMKLEPTAAVPACLSSSDEGRMYYDKNLKKFRGCVGFSSGQVSHGWVNLH